MKRFALVVAALVAVVGVQLDAQQRPLTAIADDFEKLVQELRLIALPPAPPATGTTYNPTSGAELQAAIGKAKGGDRIVLAPGQTYTAEVVLPTVAAGVVTITSGSTLPDRRIGPGDAALLATIDAGVLAPAITAQGVRGWTIDGVALKSPRVDGDVVVLYDAQDVTFDRVLIVAGPAGQKRGIRGNGKNITLTRSYIANIVRSGQDSQAFVAWDGAGPYRITDNYLEASGENVMFGGADNRGADYIPSDILVEGNLLTKNVAWKTTFPGSVKNLFELKMARRVVVRGNTFEHNWTDAQAGTAINFKVANQDGGNPWAVTEDVLFENNVVRDTEHGIGLLGNDYGNPSGRMQRITIRGNLIQCSGVALKAGAEVGGLTVDRNTFENGGTLFSLYNGDVWAAGAPGPRPGQFAIEKFVYTNNVGNHNDYGFKGDGTAPGSPTLAVFTPAAAFTSNVLIGYLGKASYPQPTWNALADVPAGVVVGR